MKKLSSKKSINIVAGARIDRLRKQTFKCEVQGSARACRRAARIRARM